MANRRFTQFYNTLHYKPVQLDCNFIVDSTNGNGLGIRSLKGPGIANVYMHTSATPATGNPNPASGFIIVNFQDNYNRYYFGGSGFVSPASGSSVVVTAAGAALVVGGAYIIVSLGTTTTAQWHTLGVPAGTTPAVGVPFIAAVTGVGAGTGAVQVPATAGSKIDSVEVVGDPNLSIVSASAAILGSPGGSGAYMVLQCLAATSAGVTTKIPTAPVNGSVVGLSFVFSNSSILVQGE